jgi:hypothetical protein
MAKKLSPKDKAFNAMLAALKQTTSRADADLKAKFSGRTTQCQRDYAMCIEAIKQAEQALATR